VRHGGGCDLSTFSIAGLPFAPSEQDILNGAVGQFRGGAGFLLFRVDANENIPDQGAQNGYVGAWSRRLLCCNNVCGKAGFPDNPPKGGGGALPSEISASLAGSARAWSQRQAVDVTDYNTAVMSAIMPPTATNELVVQLLAGTRRAGLGNLLVPLARELSAAQAKAEVEARLYSNRSSSSTEDLDPDPGAVRYVWYPNVTLPKSATWDMVPTVGSNNTTNTTVGGSSRVMSNSFGTINDAYYSNVQNVNDGVNGKRDQEGSNVTTFAGTDRDYTNPNSTLANPENITAGNESSTSSTAKIVIAVLAVIACGMLLAFVYLRLLTKSKTSGATAIPSTVALGNTAKANGGTIGKAQFPAAGKQHRAMAALTGGVNNPAYAAIPTTTVLSSTDDSVTVLTTATHANRSLPLLPVDNPSYVTFAASNGVIPVYATVSSSDAGAAYATVSSNDGAIYAIPFEEPSKSDAQRLHVTTTSV